MKLLEKPIVLCISDEKLVCEGVQADIVLFCVILQSFERLLGDTERNCDRLLLQNLHQTVNLAGANINFLLRLFQVSCTVSVATLPRSFGLSSVEYCSSPQLCQYVRIGCKRYLLII